MIITYIKQLVTDFLSNFRIPFKLEIIAISVFILLVLIMCLKRSDK
jgi:hypothetical protein